MSAEAIILDAGDDDFEAQVVERSRGIPVVVDFWAPWCGPCRALGPILERVAKAQAGEFALVKVNVDESPGVAGKYAVRSIPLVIGFRDGAPAAQFVGAKPEAAVRDFVRSLVPSESERRVAEGESRLADDPDAAEALFREVLEGDPNCGRARLGLGRVLGGRGEIEEALRLVEGIVGSPELEQQADRLAAELRMGAAAAADDEALHQALESNPDDHASRVTLGRSLAARGRYEAGLEALLEAVRRDAEWDDGAARKAILDVFELLGDDPLVDRFRRELARALYR